MCDTLDTLYKLQIVCRMSYRWHTLHNIITRYFVLVIIAQSPAYNNYSALLLLQKKQGEGRTRLYLAGVSVASLLLDSAALPQTTSSNQEISEDRFVFWRFFLLALSARAALVHPPLQILRDTLSPARSTVPKLWAQGLTQAPRVVLLIRQDSRRDKISTLLGKASRIGST